MSPDLRILLICTWGLVLLIAFVAFHPGSEELLYRWQTIMGAGVALLGAWLTVRKIRSQIDLAESHEGARIRRMHQSRLAALPMTLSSLCEYLREVYTSLEDARALQRNGGNSAVVQGWSYPSLAPEILVEMQRYLEATDEPKAIAMVTGIFQQLQTLSARMRDLKDPTNMAALVSVQLNLVEYQFQTGTIYSMVEAMFPFSRGEVDTPPAFVDRTTVVSRLDILSNHSSPDATFLQRLQTFTAPTTPAWPREPS